MKFSPRSVLLRFRRNPTQDLFFEQTNFSATYRQTYRIFHAEVQWPTSYYHRRYDDIKMDFCEIGCKDVKWVELVQDRCHLEQEMSASVLFE